MREGESCSAAARLLKNHEADLRSALGFPSPSGNALSDLMKDIPLDQNAKMVLAHAVNEAEMDNSFYIYTDHLLRGMLRFPNERSRSHEGYSSRSKRKDGPCSCGQRS